MASCRLRKNKDIKIKKIKMSTDGHLTPPVSQPIRNQQNSFFWGVSGMPRSGKTNLIISLLEDDNVFNGRFNKVFFFSPSINTVSNGLPIPDSQIYNGYDANLINEIIDDLNARENVEKQCDVLMIFDDLMASIKKKDNSFLSLVANRRHKILGGSISIILITQKFNKIPRQFRDMYSAVIMFRPSTKKEMASIYDEVIILDRQDSQMLFDLTFSERHNFLYIDLTEGNREKRYFPNFGRLEWYD